MWQRINKFLFFTGLIFLAACSHKTKNKIIPGDMKEAIRLYNDTLNTRLYVEQENDSSSVTVTGNHWFDTGQNDTSLQIILDRKLLHGIKVKTDKDGNFSFQLPRFSQVMQHTLNVIQYSREGEKKEASVKFSILPRDE